MSERQTSPYDSIARRWHALAERRRAHVIELRESGRWKHYYTAEELLEALREAVNMRDAWAKIAGLQPDEASQADDEGDET
ncbi:MAG: TIGR03809 family protein, partial [Candidatus Sulfotelmatobacter sp.]